MLCGNKGLAKTSSTPGKTQLINHFLIDNSWYIVDLPGYGYAKTSKVKREIFGKMIRGYLTNRTNMVCLFVLVDIRIEPKPIDLDFMRGLGEAKIPFTIVFTKNDKLREASAKKNLEDYTTLLLTEWESLPQIFITSSQNGEGREEILKFIKEINSGWKR